jgi:N-acyl-D-aspartate/D-glutamate deacylase
MSVAHDIIVRDGLIADGTGTAPFRGDIALRGDRIAAIGRIAGTAPIEINASGYLVTPGFVDIHTHYDGQAIWSRHLSPSSAHGVTTVVMGNCGVGFAPCRPQDRELLIRVMEGVEDIPGVVMAEGLPWDWETFPQYLDALARRQRDIDVAAFLPHSPLRVYVMGERGANREPANAADLARMRDLTREAMAAGAVGVASSRLFIHRTKAGAQIPSFDAPREELHALAAGMTDAGCGLLQLVLDAPFRPWDSEITQLIEVVERSGRPATFTLGTGNTGPRTWEAALAQMEAANARGARISAQVLPRPIGLVASHELSIQPFCLCPSYAPLATLPIEERIVELRKPEVRARLLAESPGDGHPLAMIARNWDWMFPFTDPPNYAPPREQSIAALAAASGRTPEEVAYDHLLGEGGTAMLYNALGNFHEGRLETLRELLGRSDTVLGLGDGGAHYGAICDASYPTFVLCYWTRDRVGSRLSIESAVRMLTRVPAEVVGLVDRGLLAPGYKADLNVIDTTRLQLHRPEIRRDLPSGGRRLDQRATGYVATIVSGQIVRRHDAATAALPGRVVRGAQPAPAAH